jgi:immunoglobulin-binding protein 1
MSINQTETASDKDPIDLDNMTVSELFDKGWKLQQELMKSSSCESSQDYMLKRKQAIEVLEKCASGLDELHLFSANESIDEVSTIEFR